MVNLNPDIAHQRWVLENTEKQSKHFRELTHSPIVTQWIGSICGLKKTNHAELAKTTMNGGLQLTKCST
jgi:hypothetical protein